MKIFSHSVIGNIRRLLFTSKDSKWNAFVRHITSYFG